MSLSHEQAGLKILAKIKIYILSRAKLLFKVWDEIPYFYNIGYSLFKGNLKGISKAEETIFTHFVFCAVQWFSSYMHNMQGEKKELLLRW